MSIYKINYTDTAKTPIFLNAGVLNSSLLDITLIGMNVMEYGVEFDDNTLHLLENFAAYEDPNKHDTPDLSKVITPVLSHPTQGELWFNKTQLVLFVYTGSFWKPLMTRDNVSGNSGIIVHGEQLPLPSGITSYDNCSWFVSPQYIDTQSNYIECYTDMNAIVYSRYRPVNAIDLVEGLANYIIIGIKNLDNEHIPFPLPSIPPPPSATLTPTPTLSLTPTISITPTNTPIPGVTSTSTPTITPSQTSTLTPTVTATPTISITPSATSLPTPTPTMTISVSPFVKTYVMTAKLGNSGAVGPAIPSGFYNNGGGINSAGNFGTMVPNTNFPAPNTPYYNSYAISQLFAFMTNNKLQFTLATIPSGVPPPQNAFNEISFVDNVGTLHQFFSNVSVQYTTNTGAYANYSTSTWIWTYSGISSPIFLNNGNYIINIQ